MHTLRMGVASSCCPVLNMLFVSPKTPHTRETNDSHLAVFFRPYAAVCRWPGVATVYMVMPWHQQVANPRAQVQGRALYVAPAHKKPDLRARGEASSSVISPMPGPAPPVYSHEPMPPSPQWGMVPGAYPGATDFQCTEYNSI